MTADEVKARAGEEGFDLCGIAPVHGLPELAHLREWLARGYAGRMAYLPRTAARREDVRRVLPSAQSVIVTGTVYNTARPLSIDRRDEREALVSRYAWGDDYHDVLGRRLASLVAWMRIRGGAGVEARAYVDTGPVQERVFARHAGLGWIGKNTCLVNAGTGSWLFLAVVITNLPLQPDSPVPARCGTCTRCLDACPTGALVAPRVLDATRCLSYLTIEAKGPIPEALRVPMGRRIFGCDVCQDVCPWNRRAPVTSAPEWQPRPGLDAPRLLDLSRLGDEALSRLVEGGPMTRPGLAGLRRNLQVAVANSGEVLG